MIIFVGIHNKLGMLPLDSGTKSGKIIDRVINQLEPLECKKTNLCNVEFLPKENEMYKYSRDWHWRINPQLKDIVILLGKIVQKNFYARGLKTIEIVHPAAIYGTGNIEKYIYGTVNKIKNITL
jgi:hypothetical protein